MRALLRVWEPSWLRHPWIRHLRLGFNLLLAPIFLWGVLLAGGTLASPDMWLAFVSLHVFLYGGANAFNSYYDRDEGPIGGMLEPPPVDRGLLPFSLAFQALGLPLAWWVGPTFAWTWLALFLVFTAYSHPAVRLKASPWGSFVAIAIGQGAVGFVAGWSSVRGQPASLLAPEAVFGALCASVLLSGLYIVTQSYQVQEDRARGDRTLPVILGPRQALRLATGVLALGGLSIVAFSALEFGIFWAMALAAVFCVEGLWLWRFASRFDPSDVAHNFHRVMAFASAAAGTLALFIVWHLLR